MYLVNARHTKTLPGRKSDVQESQWLLKLHTHGLLNTPFQPPAETHVLRTYWRQRAEHVSGAATCIQRMQKALTQMNLQFVKRDHRLRSGWRKRSGVPLANQQGRDRVFQHASPSGTEAKGEETRFRFGRIRSLALRRSARSVAQRGYKTVTANHVR